MLSSVTKILKHAAYQEIIAMGVANPDRMLPLILRELRDRPGFWSDALKTIVGESPVPEAERSDPKCVREAWLKWGREKHLIDPVA
jgi:hypothetical protein